MVRRVFVGLPLSDQLRISFAEFAWQHRDHPGIRLVHPSNYHLTLCFIGEIPEELLQNLLSTVQLVCNRHQSFTLRFNRYSLAPARRDARMIWAKFLVEGAFSQLSKDLCQTFRQFSIKHKYHENPIPHVTLARFPEAQYPELKSANHLSLQLTARRVCVWESIVEHDQRIYQPLSFFYLK